MDSETSLVSVPVLSDAALVLEGVNDPVLLRVTNLLEQARSQNSKHLEVEVRIGTFSEANHFVAGYNNVALSGKLLSRLRKNGSQKSNWTTLNQQTSLNAEYPGNIRKRVTPPNKVPSICVKRKLATIDLGSDRVFGFRVCLSEEKPVELSKSLESSEPLSVRYCERASFTQRLEVGTNFFVNLQYDISKVTVPSKDKKECTKLPAEYHCEVELMDKLFTMGNPEEERRQSMMIAYAMLHQAKALLGTHRFNGETFEPLPRPTLHLIAHST